jgi:hypothetical protein
MRKRILKETLYEGYSYCLYKGLLSNPTHIKLSTRVYKQIDGFIKIPKTEDEYIIFFNPTEGLDALMNLLPTVVTSMTLVGIMSAIKKDKKK